MPIPVNPVELRALVPTAEDDLCTIIKKAHLFRIRFWQIWKYWFDNNGVMTGEFTNEICEAYKRELPPLT